MRLKQAMLLTALLIFVAMPNLVSADNISIDNLPPVVVKTVPPSGADNVDPNLDEIRVTFSKEMQDGNWSYVYQTRESFPTLVGNPRYHSDKRTNIVKVKLEPNKTYVVWLNSQKFQNFKDLKKNPAIPYLLVFKTRSK